MHPLLVKLTGTDRRSIGRSNDVVAEVLTRPPLFSVLFKGMLENDPVLRMRCADAVEKVTRTRPDLLRPYKKQLIQRVARIDQQEVRWHVAQLFTRLALTSRERRNIIRILDVYLDDKSSIVRTFSMQALAEIAQQDPALRSDLGRRLETLARIGTPAMRARGKKLVVRLKAK